MRRPLPFISLALAAVTSVAQGADPLKSTDCVRALDALQAQEATLIADAPHPGASESAGSARMASLKTLQRQAAQACLGSRLDAPPPVQRFARPQIAVAPATPPSAAWAVVPPVPAAALPPIRSTPLRTITTCDLAGCWTNDGTRLQRMGSILVGPLGLCTVLGAVLSCQ